MFFTAKDPIIGWLLPRADSSLYVMVKHMKERLKMLKNAFPEINKKTLALLESKKCWYLDIEITFILQRFRE